MSSIEDVSVELDSRNGTPLTSEPSNEDAGNASTDNVSLETAQLIDDNESKRDIQSNEQEPIVPAHRPTRRSTTEVIDDLVENTNEELEEMEKLIRKHRTNTSTAKVAASLPHIPQRPHPKKRASNDTSESPQPKIPQRPARRSTSPLKSTIPITGEEPTDSNKDNDSQITPPVIPQQRPLKRKTTSPSLESSVPSNVGCPDETETESVTGPTLPKERPTRTKQSSYKLNRTDTDEEKLGSKEPSTYEDVTQEPSNSTINSTPEEEPPKRELDESTELNEQISTFNEEPQQGSTQAKAVSSSHKTDKEEVSFDDYSKQDDKFTKSQEKVENTNEPNQEEPLEGVVTNQKVDIENREISTGADVFLKNQSFIRDEGDKEKPNDTRGDIEEDNDIVKETGSDSTLSEKPTETVQEDIIKEVLQNKEVSKPVSQSTFQESNTADVKLTTQESKSPEKEPTPVTHSEDSEISKSKQEPYIPASRPKKKGPPPVPKKPSSRIAAFQEMLQKQQMKDMENKDTNPPLGDKEKQPPRKMNFISDLNNLIALPGMVPTGDMAPNNTSKTPVDNTTKVNKELTDVRQKRARGPRGRKLPSKVNNVTKIIAKNENYTVQVKPLWSLKIVPKHDVAEIEHVESEERDYKQADEAIESDNSHPYNEDEKKIQEQEHSVSKEKSIDMPHISPSPTLEATASLSDGVTSRDEDGSVWMMEEDLETEAEKKMQEQFIEEDKKFTESLSKQTSLQLATGREYNEQRVEDDISANSDSATEDAITEHGNNM